ncbi:hypothetical protein I550_4314 [Mycobacterium intracellulare 1956]|uniref:Uncharacterized protein n=1 Tax=Mycobacterium intracellulare 1956 TaxID=1299331 RepID=X8CJZ9_MYCIT|nr:hypothetical protein I550_4314 [Mycobacterium intracellulare 1956]
MLTALEEQRVALGGTVGSGAAGCEGAAWAGNVRVDGDGRIVTVLVAVAGSLV